MQLGDLVLVTAASTDSAMNRQRLHGWDLAAAADFGMLRAVWNAARANHLQIEAGEVF
jgi:purine-nucleoside phosphorylase